MAHIMQLKDILGQRLPWHGARITFLAMFLIALFKVKTVNLAEIATALNPKAKIGSNYRRLQRFFADFELDYEVIAKLIASFIPKPDEGYTLSMDRTNWQFGKSSINLLFWALFTKGLPSRSTGCFWTRKGTPILLNELP